MTQPAQEEKNPLTVFIILILPYILFYWMVPFLADRSIGNDYQTVGIRYQMELMFSLKNGSFPLYVPGFALGHSSSALTLGEIFHPLPHLASILPGYWDGRSLECNTLLRLLSLGLTHLALFAFLRKLKINTTFSFLLSTITIYNLRMLDLFRYGASLENYTGFILLCVSLGWQFMEKNKYRGPVFIIASTYLLICGGHPQMMYYGLLGAGFYLLIIPFFVSTMRPEIFVDFKKAGRFWIQGLACMTLGIVLSSAYILPFYFEFIATNVERVQQGYGWADSVRDSLAGTANNFFLPLRSDVHGAFGGSSLIIIAAILPVLRFFRKIPCSIWAAWAVSLFVFLYMQGARTPVHELVWKYVPFASSFRYSGRITLMMPVFLMMVLAWVIKADTLSNIKNKVGTLAKPSTVLSIFAFVVSGAYLVLFMVNYAAGPLPGFESSPFAPVAFQEVPRISEAAMVLCGLVSLLMIAFLGKGPKHSGILGAFLCLATVLQIMISLQYGTWTVEKEAKPTLKQMMTEKGEHLSYRFYPGTGMYSSIVTTQLDNSFMEPFLGKIYHYAEPVSDIDNAYARMLEDRTPGRLYIEGLEQEKQLSGLQVRDNKTSTVKLMYSSFNRLKFTVYSPENAFFGLSYPHTGNWKASVNGEQVPIYRANGAAHAIEIPAGKSDLEFRYASPAFFWGVLISCITFTLTGIYASFGAASLSQRAVRGIVVIFAGAGIFLLWNHSLYTGDDIGTLYTWSYEKPSPELNLAYGKKTSMSSSWRGSAGYLHSSLAVDGDRRQKTGFKTSADVPAYWIVDLNDNEKVERIVIYEGHSSPQINKRPLDILFSNDKSSWEKVYTVTSAHNPGHPLNIIFKEPEAARYIRIETSEQSNLQIDEVEVYGPEHRR